MVMVWRDVESSTQLDAIGFDDETNTAQVKFQSGAVYEYSDVEKEVIDNIVNSSSPGRTFAQTLKYGYQYTRI